MSNSKAKFANSLRKSISNEKSKVTSSTGAPKPAETNVNPVVKAAATTVDQKNTVDHKDSAPIAAAKTAATLAKNTTKKVLANKSTKAANTKKTTPTKKPSLEKVAESATKTAQNMQQKFSNKAGEFVNNAYNNFKQEREAAKSTYDQAIFNWQNGFNDSCSRILTTMNEEISNYINNISTASSMQDVTQFNIQYFERIKKIQNDLFKDASNTYLSLLNSFSAYKK